MTVQELIDRLSKLDPDLECFTLDSIAHWCRVIDAWSESDDQKDFAYIEIYSIEN